MTATTDDQAILRSSAVMAVGTLLSRATGYLRSILLVAAVGLTLHADLFTVANTIPNALYILVAGGLLNAVLVPQLVRAMRSDEDGGEAYANRVLTLVGLVLIVISALAVLLAPWILRLYAPPDLYTPAFAGQRASLEAFARLCLPQIFFYGIYVLLGQVLNARGRFGPMMFAPIANNVIACATLVAYLIVYGTTSGGAAYSTGEQLLLGLGSTLGIAVQAALLVVPLRRSGFRFSPRLDFRDSGLGHTARLATWTLLFVVVNQLAYLVVTRLAVDYSTQTAGDAARAGGATVYQSAFLVVMVPHALVTVSLATAALPRLSGLAAADRLGELRDDLVRTMRVALAGVGLAGVVLFAEAVPLARAMFGWGAGSTDTAPIGYTLMIFVPGLIAFTVHYLALRGFYALEDTKTPFRVQCVLAATNVAVALAIFAIAGSASALALALAYTLANITGALVSTHLLARRLGGLQRLELSFFLGRVAGAAVPSGLIALAGTFAVGAAIPRTSRLADLIAVAFGSGLAVLSYTTFARIIGLREVTRIVHMATARVMRARRAGGEERARRPAPPTMGSRTAPDAEMTRVTSTEAAPTDATPTDATPIDATPIDAASIDGPVRPRTTGDDQPRTLAATSPATSSSSRGLIDGAVPGHDDDYDTGVIVGLGAWFETSGGLSRRELDDLIGGSPTADAPGAAGTDRQGAASDEQGGRVTTPALQPGTLVGGRYRLEELLAGSGGSTTWRGVDEVLSRPVALHLLPANDVRVGDLSVAARAAAGVPDPHFLRMLDVSEDGSQVFIVREWVPGRNLGVALASGPFDADDAVYVAREVASAMAAAHRAGLAHLRLEPDTIVLADSGQVKIVDLAVDRVLSGTSSDDLARTDAQGIGRVLYACLTARWPGGPAYGIQPAPTQDGRLCSPRQVLAGVPSALDEICDRILGDPPRGGRSPLATPAAVEAALEATGGQTAKRRATAPPPVAPTPPPPQGPTEPPAGWHRPDQPPAAVPAPPRRRLGTTILGVLVAVVLIGGALLLGYQLARTAFGTDAADQPSSTSTATTQPDSTPVVLPVTAATSYDLEATGGNGEENEELAPRAIDDDPSTAWTTVNYSSSMESQGKTGVGLVLDLGADHTVSSVDLTLLTAGGKVELRAAPEGTTAVPDALDTFSVIASQDAPAAQLTMTPGEPVVTRYLLVWFTELPQYQDTLKDGIAEAVVHGQ